jgi:hypothetical protein
VTPERRGVFTAAGRPPPGSLAGRRQVVVGQLGEGRLDRFGRRAAALELRAQPVPAFGAALQPRGDPVPRRPRVVEITLGGQAVEGGLDLVLGIAARRELGGKLAAEVRPPREERDRLLVAALGRGAARSGQRCSISKGEVPPMKSPSGGSSIDSSIWSREMSAVNWTPWILSLNSSGFEARRSASSSVISPPL